MRDGRMDGRMDGWWAENAQVRIFGGTTEDEADGGGLR